MTAPSTGPGAAARHPASAARTDAAVIHATVAAVRPANRAARRRAQVELDRKVKPVGSLGRLEELAIRVAGATGASTPTANTPAIVICAADHGVAAQGVSAFPQDVTAQMLTTFATGGAAVCVLARQAGAQLVVADLGVVKAPQHVEGGARVLDRRVRAGTADITVEPAMSRAEAERAVRHGIDLARELTVEGIDVVALGEMGIANTTTAAAVTAALLGVDPAAVCGRGTGVDDDRLAHKVTTVRRALARHTCEGSDALDVLARVGGLEIAALAGVALGCAAERVPVVVDGFITGAAALVAAQLAPASVDAMLAAHRSSEPGHSVQLDALGLQPLLDLQLRLGEGSGAALALPLVRMACAVLAEMATFDSAGVTSDEVG